MARKRRRKPGFPRCSICGSYQMAQELEGTICLACRGLVAIKPRRPARAQGPDGTAAQETAVARSG